jgi:deazaflavin-dependent oxidoreductase (nitroreductase family)
MNWGDRTYIRLYQRLGGRWVDRWTAGSPAILLTTTGRRSGESRTVALGHLSTEDGVVVAATNGGLPALPGWVWNLRVEPSCVVEAGADRFNATAEFLEGERYASHWRRLVADYPVYQKARRMLDRPIPLVLLHRREG